MLLHGFAYIADGMPALSVALLLLVCSAEPALSSQEDCGNNNVQTAWLFRNTPLACIRAINLLSFYGKARYLPYYLEQAKMVSMHVQLNPQRLNSIDVSSPPCMLTI